MFVIRKCRDSEFQYSREKSSPCVDSRFFGDDTIKHYLLRPILWRDLRHYYIRAYHYQR